MAYIKVKNLAVRYAIVNTNLSLRRSLITLFRAGRANSKKKGYLTSKFAVSDINLELSNGDRLALIGGNGAGKTTLLKTLSGMYEPCSGSITISGSKSSFIEIGAGMDYGLTGERNVQLHYLMRDYQKMGISRDDFVEKVRNFSDLGDSFYMPVNTYSSGMFVRLAFAMVTEVCPEILILDEWLSAGDMFFMEKANQRMDELADSAQIIVLATHSPDLALKWCNKAVVLGENGNILFDSVDDALTHYQSSN